jgi:hypothetical protein
MARRRHADDPEDHYERKYRSAPAIARSRRALSSSAGGRSTAKRLQVLCNTPMAEMCVPPELLSELVDELAVAKEHPGPARAGLDESESPVARIVEVTHESPPGRAIGAPCTMAKLRCVRCHGRHLRRSRRRGAEKLLSMLRFFPFRCEDCGVRSLRFGVRDPN